MEKEEKKQPPTIEEQQKAEHQKKLERRKELEDASKQGDPGTAPVPTSAVNGGGAPVQGEATPDPKPEAPAAPSEPPKPE